MQPVAEQNTTDQADKDQEPQKQSENYDSILKLEVTPEMDKNELSKLRGIVKSERSHF